MCGRVNHESCVIFLFFKQKTAYEMRSSDWSSDVCSSDLVPAVAMDHDLLVGLLARQHRRQHDTVVIDARLGVEDRHLIGAGSPLEEMLKHPDRKSVV